MANLGGSSRPPHIIEPDQVDAWLADSVNRQVTYHRTTREAALDTLEHGVDIGRSRIGAFGQGFYTVAVRPTDLQRGEAAVPVVIRLRRPFVGDHEEVGS